MYIPRSNQETRPEAIVAFIEAHPFGALITAGSDGLFATHLPFVLDRARGPHGVLQGHVARANPHHRQPRDAKEALVIFTGPDAYITPSWYAAKQEHGRVVPTWNYVAVHVYGTLRFSDDADYLRTHLEELTRQHEHGRERPWSVADAPDDFIAQLSRAIVGVELEITRMEGKWKMSQNRSDEDIEGVIRGLELSSDPAARHTAQIMEERRRVPHTPGGAE
jgi:transcriptional regulator